MKTNERRLRHVLTIVSLGFVFVVVVFYVWIRVNSYYGGLPGSLSFLVSTGVKITNKYKTSLTISQTVPENSMKPSDPRLSETYRFSTVRKTIWQDASLGLKITAPEWEDSRDTNGDKDINGKLIYSEWSRISPQMSVSPNSIYVNKTIRDNLNVKVFALRNDLFFRSSESDSFADATLTILPLGYKGKTFSDVINGSFIQIGSCEPFYYDKGRDNLMRNFIISKNLKIGNFNAQLVHLNKDFGDCRADDTLIIKAKGGRFVMSTLWLDNETVKIEAL